jgi:hypothetical protein
VVVVVPVLLVTGVVVAVAAALRSPCAVAPVRCGLAPRLSFPYASLAGWRNEFPMLPFAHSLIVRSLAQPLARFVTQFPVSRMHAWPQTSLGLLALLRF